MVPGSLPRVVTGLKWLLIEVFCLIALGGGVRAMNAGLACPDWPLCFGDFIPDYHPQVYFEFIHRALAGIVTLVTLFLTYVLWRRPDVPRGLRRLSILAVIVLFAQVILGGLTVLLMLHEKVVTAHLAFGTTFFSLLLWIYLSLKDQAQPQPFRVSPGLAYFSVFMAAVIFGQILLGGLVASHYAALACTDFPLCHGQWIPTLSGAIGLHVIHRLGAYFTFLTVLTFVIWTLRSTSSQKMRQRAWLLLALLILQINIGVANVIFHTPPLITVMHLATGVAIFGVALRHVFGVRHLLFSSAAYPAAALAPNPETL